jgi:hypothetical protein
VLTTTKETITSEEKSSTPITDSPRKEVTNSQTLEYSIYFIFGALDILLAFRLILKLMGASLASPFVGFIYGLTGIFILPFEGIFRRGLNQGLETTSIFEPSTLIAVIVYLILAWGIVKLVRVVSGEKQPS